KLVDGKPHSIKKNVDEATARKFKAVLTQAGLLTLVRAAESAVPAPASETATTQALAAEAVLTTSELDLAPPGTPALKDDERTEVAAPELDLSRLTLDEMKPWSGSCAPEPTPVEPPDFSLAPAGADIETLPDTREKLNPDTSKLDIDEPGAILGTKKKEAPPAPNTNHIKLKKHNPFL
ncbi:MAG: hypothetical protein ACI89D_001472, partial [Bermanella sp.]